MKLTNNMRSKLAEKICLGWIRKSKTRVAVPKVYVVWRSSRGQSDVWGRAYQSQRRIILHLGVKSSYKEWLIILAHEFAHIFDYATTPPRWKALRRPHGDRFQILLWRFVPKTMWAIASTGRWAVGSSRHLPQYQHVTAEV